MTVVSVVCRCGRVYFESQSAALWACARRHMEGEQRIRDLQTEIARMIDRELERLFRGGLERHEGQN